MNKSVVKTFNIIWWICVAINSISLVWFVLGSTANFQRGIDLVETVILVLCGIPSLLLVVVSLIILLKGGVKSFLSMLGVTLILAALIYLSIPLYTNVNIKGWLIERVQTDTLQITEDNKYEYNIEVVNEFQRNSSIRLYLRNLQNDIEQRIKLDLPEPRGVFWKTGGVLC